MPSSLPQRKPLVLRVTKFLVVGTLGAALLHGWPVNAGFACPTDYRGDCVVQARADSESAQRPGGIDTPFTKG